MSTMARDIWCPSTAVTSDFYETDYQISQSPGPDLLFQIIPLKYTSEVQI